MFVACGQMNTAIDLNEVALNAVALEIPESADAHREVSRRYYSRQLTMRQADFVQGQTLH